MSPQRHHGECLDMVGGTPASDGCPAAGRAVLPLSSSFDERGPRLPRASAEAHGFGHPSSPCATSRRGGSRRPSLVLNRRPAPATNGDSTSAPEWNFGLSRPKRDSRTLTATSWAELSGRRSRVRVPSLPLPTSVHSRLFLVHEGGGGASRPGGDGEPHAHIGRTPYERSRNTPEQSCQGSTSQRKNVRSRNGFRDLHFALNRRRG